MTMDARSAPEARKLLDELVVASGAVNAVLVGKDGALLGEGGDSATMDTTAMAALVAGMFAATREVARIVGENQFSILLQQGERRHIHISLVDPATMMVIVFEDQARIGRVRLEARRSGERVAQHLARRGPSNVIPAEVSSPQFREVALNLIDSIFLARPR
jgi:predicted regulator of Ras-like GTPase activity (Roadblock/LC7/MglB family)